MSNMSIANRRSAFKVRSRINPLRHGIYFYVLESTWRSAFSMVIGIYFLLNFIFALLYFSLPESLSGHENISFFDTLFFSIQTFSTIGYGVLAPHSLTANFLVSLEAITSLIYTALVTGLVFAKFSIPRAHILFSKKAVIKKMDGKDTLLFRMGNSRGNDIADAEVSVAVLTDYKTPEGDQYRKVEDLVLVRTKTPFFRLSWTVMHTVTENSPLFPLASRNEATFAALVITVHGHDSTFNSQVYARHTYNPDDVLVNHVFDDVLFQQPDGTWYVNYELFHSVRPTLSTASASLENR